MTISLGACPTTPLSGGAPSHSSERVRQEEKGAGSRDRASALCWGARMTNHPYHGRPRQIQRLKATEGRHVVSTGSGVPSDLETTQALKVLPNPCRLGKSLLLCTTALAGPSAPPTPLLRSTRVPARVWVQASWWGASSISMRKVSMGVSPMSLKKNRCSRHLRPMERRAGRRSSSLANRPCCSGYFCLQ